MSKNKPTLDTKAVIGKPPEGDESLIEFPCEYQLKVMGKDSSEFHSAVCAVVDKHAPGTEEGAYSRKASSGGKFVSVSVLVNVDSRTHLETIYGALKDSGHVLYLL